MSKKKTGGSAFPVAGYQETGGYVLPTEGMSLRDYFAGQALVGLTVDYINHPKDINHEIVAKQTYKFADAMLAEREKGERADVRVIPAEI